MSIQIRLLEDQHILEITYSSDDITSKDLAEQRRIVAKALSKNVLNKALVDMSSLIKFPSTLTIFEHNEAVLAQHVLRKTKFAVLCQTLGPNEQFLEITGTNRGVQIKCFTSRKEALAWLTAQTGGDPNP